MRPNFLRAAFGMGGSDFVKVQGGFSFVMDNACWVVRTSTDETNLSLRANAHAWSDSCSGGEGLLVPKFRRAIDGGVYARTNDEEGGVLFAYVHEQPEGIPVVPNLLGHPIPADQLRRLGKFRASLLKSLRGFLHAGMLLHGTHDKHSDAWKGLRCQAVVGGEHPLSTTLLDSDGNFALSSFDSVSWDALAADVARCVLDLVGENDADDDETEHKAFNVALGFSSSIRLEEEDVQLILRMLAEARGRIAAKRDRFESLLRDAAGLPGSGDSMRSVQSPVLLERRRKVLGNRLRLFFDPKVLRVVRGEGVWLYDVDGNRHLDCYNNVVSVGHCHPYVVQKMERQAHLLNTNTRYLTEGSTRYAERLVAAMGHPSLDSVIFCNSGSEANDIAYRVSRAVTGKTGGLTMHNAYHGITDSLMGFTPSNYRTAKLPPHMRILPAPDLFRGPYKRGEADVGEKYAALADEAIASLKNSEYGVACCMIDSCFMSNGVLDAPDGYVRGVAKRVQAAGGLFVADEVQSGFGRTGTSLWGYMHHGVVPDMVTIGKPAGNGHPIGAVILRRELLDAFNDQFSFFSTFGGNNVSCAAGMAVLDVVEREKLVENARVVGAYLKARLASLVPLHKYCGDVHGVGFAIGMEIVKDKATLEPSKDLCFELLRILRTRGVLCGSDGPYDSCVKIRPPLVFSKENADLAYETFHEALKVLEEQQ